MLEKDSSLIVARIVSQHKFSRIDRSSVSVRFENQEVPLAYDKGRRKVEGVAGYGHRRNGQESFNGLSRFTVTKLSLRSGIPHIYFMPCYA